MRSVLGWGLEMANAALKLALQRVKELPPELAVGLLLRCAQAGLASEVCHLAMKVCKTINASHAPYSPAALNCMSLQPQVRAHPEHHNAICSARYAELIIKPGPNDWLD